MNGKKIPKMLMLGLMAVCIICSGYAFADDVQIEDMDTINFQVVSENYTFSLDNGPVLKNYWAVSYNGTTPPDNYTWSVDAVNGGPVTFTSPSPKDPKNYDNQTFVNPGRYLVTCVGENSSTSPSPASKTNTTTFWATKTIGDNFTYAPTGVNNQVNFTYLYNSTSPLASLFDWNFGDLKGNKTPVPDNNRTFFYTYDHPGTYTVTVTAKNLTPGYSEFILPSSNSTLVTVNASPVADFWIAGNYTKHITPFTAEFHNNSTNATTYTWGFGDGSSEDNLSPDISHNYTLPGRYWVNLTARSDWGSNTTSKLLIGYINISGNFTYESEPCPAFPVNITFRDNSTGTKPDTWLWDFGDGTNSGIIPTSSITHSYHYPQLYNVSMTTWNNTYEISNLTNQTVNVTGLYADFTRVPSSNIFIFRGDKATVQMNSTSMGTDYLTYYDWNLGNNLTSIHKNVTAQYEAGNYNVSLTISNRTCGSSNTTTQQVHVYEWLVSAFTSNPSYGSFPLTVQFEDNSTDNPTQWQWDFYDLSETKVGTNTTSSRPTFSYSQPGTYRVDMITRNGFGQESNLYTRYITLSTGITADFTANLTKGVAPLTVLFTDNSTPTATISNRTWSFSDGQPNSTSLNPVRTFSQPGNYTITLTAWNASSGSAGSRQRQDYILVGSPLQANFAPNSSIKVNSSLLVNFTDLSTPANQITNWSWNFGDNQSISNLQNPVHQFPGFGIYNITLNVSNWFYGSSNVTTFPLNITERVIPVAKFEGNPRTVNTNQTVSFSDRSEGPEINGWNWTFGDGVTSNQTRPTHGYTYAGMYDVTLDVTNPYGTGTLTEPDYIRVKGPVIADFITDPADWGVVNQPVSFIDTSLGQPISWIWSFGDGNTTTTTVNPVSHTYTSTGWYTINMSATNWDGQSDTAVNQILIEDKARPRDVNFGAVGKRYSGVGPFTVQFEDLTPSQSNVTEWYWDFGDRTNFFSETRTPPTHTYTLPGEYTVTLTVRNDYGVNEKIRVAYVVVV